MFRSYYLFLSLLIGLIASACSSEDNLSEPALNKQNIELRVAVRSFVSNADDGQTEQEAAIKNLSFFIFDRNGQEIIQQSRQHPVQNGKVLLSITTEDAQGPLNAYMIANEKGFAAVPMTETELLSYKTQSRPADFIANGFPMSSAAVVIQPNASHTSASVTLERIPSAIYVQVDASAAGTEIINNNAYQVEVEGLQITEGALFHDIASSMEAQARVDYSSKLTAVNSPENIAYFYQSSQIKIHITPRDPKLGETKTVTIAPEKSIIRNKKFLLQIKPVKIPVGDPDMQEMTFTVSVAEWKTDVIIVEIPTVDVPEPPMPDPVGDVVLFSEGVSVESGWYDNNKSRGAGGFSNDGRMCWAMAESNMIQWWQDRYIAGGEVLPVGTPNGIVPGRENEKYRRLAVFEEFHVKFPNIGAVVLRGIPDYFTTYFPDIFVDKKPFFEEGTYAKDKVFKNFKEFSDFVVAGLKDRGVISLRIAVPGHAVTLWGVTYNTETGLVKNIFMSDSDDMDDGKIFHGIWKNRPVGENHSGKPILEGVNWVIESATVLYAYPGKPK